MGEPSHATCAMKLAFECKHCLKKYRCDDSRHQHLVKFHGYEPRDYQCAECPKKFRWKNHLNTHMAEGHKYANVRLECGLCPSTFQHRHHYVQHMKIAHDPTKRTYECKECFRIFARRDNFIVHLKNEHGPKCVVHKCKLCHKVYKNKAGLKLHFDMNHKENVPRSKCPFCPSEFKWPQHLKQHMSKLHMRQSFASTENVIEVKHLGNQNNRCVMCMVPFTSKIDMLVHLTNKHNLDVDVYKCCQCEAVFTLKEPLRIHIQEQHVRDGTHACLQCYPIVSPIPFIENPSQSDDAEVTIDKELEDFQESLMADEQLRRYVRYKLKHIKTNQHYTKGREDVDDSDSNQYEDEHFNDNSSDSNWDFPEISADENDSICDINPQLVCEVTMNSTAKTILKESIALDKAQIGIDTADQISSGRDETNFFGDDLTMMSINAPKEATFTSKSVLDKVLVIQIERIQIKELTMSVANIENTENRAIHVVETDKEQQQDSLPKKQGIQSRKKSLRTSSTENICKENGIQQYECSKCDYTFKLQKTLDQHIKFAHTPSTGKLACKSCSRVFDDKLTLKKHKRQHFGEYAIFKCDVCALLFKTRAVLNKHLEIHRDQKQKNKEYELFLETAEKDQVEMAVNDTQIGKPTEENNTTETDSFKEIEPIYRDEQVLKQTNSILSEADIPSCDNLSSKTEDTLENTADKVKIRQRKFIKETEDVNLPEKIASSVSKTGAPKCSNCNKKFTKENNVGNHVCKKMQCKHCDLTFYKVLDIARHVKFDHILPLKIAAKKSYKCQQPGCNLTFDKVIDLARHSRCKHKGSVKPTKDKVKKRQSNYKCKHCSTIFESSQKMAIHTRFAHNVRKTMKKSNKKRNETMKQNPNLRSESVIEEHSAEPNNIQIENYLKEQFNINRHDTPSPVSDDAKKKSEKSYECGKCVLFFPSKLELLCHISDKHMYIPDINVLIEAAPKTRRSANKPLQCHYCEKTFTNKQHLIKHLKNSHAEPKSYQCISCSEIFNCEDAYKDHIKMKHQNKCGICNVSFVHQEKLYFHIKSQHKEKISHKCSQCNALFKLKFSLARHMDEFHKPKAAPQMTNAKVRVTDELMQRMHMCVHCNALFPLQASLQRHIEWQHSEEKRLHKCGQCTAIFNDIEELVEHMQIEHRAEVLRNN